MTQQVHQDVNTNIRVGQLGGEGMPKPMEQSTFRAADVDAGLPERAQYPILQGAAGDALAVATRRTTLRRRASRPVPRWGRSDE